MAATRAELYRLGISAGGGARETARITRETDRYNQQLAEQERRLRDVGERQRKLNAIRAKADKMRDVRNNPGGERCRDDGRRGDNGRDAAGAYSRLLGIRERRKPAGRLNDGAGRKGGA